MLIALYWAWNYTTWMTNWFDPDTVPVRLVLVFSGLQIGRNTFVVAVTPRGRFVPNCASRHEQQTKGARVARSPPGAGAVVRF
jgi:hypothetical protein